MLPFPQRPPWQSVPAAAATPRSNSSCPAWASAPGRNHIFARDYTPLDLDNIFNHRFCMGAFFVLNQRTEHVVLIAGFGVALFFLWLPFVTSCAARGVLHHHHCISAQRDGGAGHDLNGLTRGHRQVVGVAGLYLAYNPQQGSPLLILVGRPDGKAVTGGAGKWREVTIGQDRFRQHSSQCLKQWEVFNPAFCLSRMPLQYRRTAS